MRRAAGAGGDLLGDDVATLEVDFVTGAGDDLIGAPGTRAATSRCICCQIDS
jgi:hypothetical protein